MKLYSIIIVMLIAFVSDVKSTDIKMVNIPAGFFYMGSNGLGENFDEAPIHRVNISRNFKMSETEVTNIQFEQFDSLHRQLRGKFGFSKEDNEAVINVSWYDAVAFCNWLSKKEGKNYRLPTEAEWEYACHSGHYWDYAIGGKLHHDIKKNQLHNNFIPISLKVKNGPCNNFGLYDMNGNVEEWCLDWYGPYTAEELTDPVGYKDGEFKVTRGGSHSTPDRFLRSTNRSAMIPEDKHFYTGFRIVEAAMPITKPIENLNVTSSMQANVSQKMFKWSNPTNTPIFMEPLVYIKIPVENNRTPLYSHNHCPAITWCSNGDILAIWFSTNDEFGREMYIAGSRLKLDSNQWQCASEFYRIPDRNMTGSSIYYDKDDGNLYHINGVGVAGWWRNLAMVMRTSSDNGATWSKGKLVVPEHTKGNQVIAGSFKTKEGWLIQPCDAGPNNDEGSVIHLSKDNGKTWTNPAVAFESNFKENETGGIIAGIHAGVVQLKNGDLYALGRGNNIKDKNGNIKMPCSVSKDMGKTWTYSAAEFPPIVGGQRLVLRRLNEGPLLFIGFTPLETYHNSDKEGMLFVKNGEKYRGYGMYAAISYDEGKTWPIKKLITDGKHRFMDGGAWTGHFILDDTHSEPKGYLAATQTPDGVIHLISSRNHYRFNLAWIEN